MLNTNKTLKKSVFFKLSIIAADILVCLIVIFVDDVINVMKLLAPRCLLDTIGLKCGICGATHCVYYLLHGNITDAFQSNLLVPIAILFFFVNYVICHAAYLFNVKQAKYFLKKRIFTLPCFFGITVPFLLYGLIRSIVAVLI